MWQITRGWYGDRLDPDYRPAPIAQLQAILTGAGLTSEFWQIAP